jgi:hypothetical protein
MGTGAAGVTTRRDRPRDVCRCRAWPVRRRLDVARLPVPSRDSTARHRRRRSSWSSSRR